MQLTRIILPLPLLALSLLAQDVRYNFDSGTNFAKYKTYKWGVIKGATQLDQISDQQLKTAFDAELAKKGLTKVDGEAPADLYIGYQAALSSETQVTTFDSGGWGYGPGWGYG